ncbi:MAG: T9SS type A sorting domain-containing protein [bacterium]|nr:T9SS type A sorting domain-containing protein [bacterium]
MQTWVVPEENKWPALYSRKTDGNQIFKSVFEQSGTGNAAPRSIRYKGFNGTSWTGSVQVSDTTTDVTGLQRPEVGELAGDVAIYAFAGANSLGVYFDNSSWTPSDVSEIPSNIPTEYLLEQNYPNPFNPSTTIKFRIPEGSYVSLKVYNVLGKEIATLVSEEMNAGTYEVNFDASNLSSGVYFYKIESGNFVKTNKMILMK